jgi:hypothetical protein
MLTIEQKRFLRPNQVLQLTDDGFLCLTVKRFLSKREFKLDLQDFKPESSWQKVFPKGTFALAVFCTVLTLLAGSIAALHQDEAGRLVFLAIAGFWFCGALLSGAFFWFTRSEFIAYFHRFSGEVLVVIYTDIPDADKVQRFVRALDARLLGIHRTERSATHGRIILPGWGESDSRCSLN